MFPDGRARFGAPLECPTWHLGSDGRCLVQVAHGPASHAEGPEAGGPEDVITGDDWVEAIATGEIVHPALRPPDPPRGRAKWLAERGGTCDCPGRWRITPAGERELNELIERGQMPDPLPYRSGYCS